MRERKSFSQTRQQQSALKTKLRAVSHCHLACLPKYERTTRHHKLFCSSDAFWRSRRLLFTPSSSFREEMKIGNINIVLVLDSKMNSDTLSAPLKLKKITTKDIAAYERQTSYKINICPEKFKTNNKYHSNNEYQRTMANKSQ